MLIARLERLSADSVWAHRASGLRGSLLHAQQQLESGYEPNDEFLRLIESAHRVLVAAGKELPDPEKNQREF